MNCPNCGAPLPEGAKFCGSCGMQVGAQMNAPAPSTNEPAQPQSGFVQQPQSGSLPPPPSGFNQAPGGAGFNQAAGKGINIDTDGTGQGRGYSYEILHQPSYSLAVVQLQAEQSILAEAGAMVSMSANVELQAQMKGGLMGALKRAVGGESAFVSTFTARGGPGEVTPG